MFAITLIALLAVLIFKVLPFAYKQSKAADEALYNEIMRLNDRCKNKHAHR